MPGTSDHSHQGRGDFVDYSLCENIARDLAKISLEGTSFDLPTDVRYLDLIEYNNPEEIDFGSLWLEQGKSSPTLKTAIGLKPGQRILTLNLRQNQHGPHGLIAGTTRSGKSELLQTILIGLAIKHHPHYLNFVLVDYKGGTTFSVLKDLPHTVGVVTDLDGKQTIRALVALEKELARRESILAECEVADLDKYYDNGFHNKRSDSIPYLLIMIDEFAMLRQHFKNDWTSLIDKFNSIAARGGGLGVHLILAMQSPEGVVDSKISANINFRICLRVQNDSESRSMLETTDAAKIGVSGRAYLKVGKQQVYDQFQVARVAGYYSQRGNVLLSDFKFLMWLTMVEKR